MRDVSNVAFHALLTSFHCYFVMFEECKTMRPLSANISFHGGVVVKTTWVKTIIITFRLNLTPWLQMVWNQAQNKAISNETKLNLVRKCHKKFQLQKKIWYFINFLVRLFGFHLFKLFCAQSEPKMFETETKLEWSNLLKKCVVVLTDAFDILCIQR